MPALRLAGIVVAGPVRQAIFAAPDGTMLLVDEGGRLGAFTVRAIRRDEVEVMGAGGSVVLSPSPDAVLRDEWRLLPANVPLIDPVRREAETESDQ